MEVPEDEAAQVERHERPALPPTALHEPGEVVERAAETVELGDHQDVSPTLPQGE